LRESTVLVERRGSASGDGVDAGFQERDFGSVVGAVDRCAVGNRFCSVCPKEPEEVAADRVVKVIAVEGQPSMRLSAACGPCIPATATARLSATIGVLVRDRSWS
jgi:hypothetical protein